MKRLMTVALALAFLGTTTAVSFAQDTSRPKKKATKASSKKKGGKKKEELPQKENVPKKA